MKRILALILMGLLLNAVFYASSPIPNDSSKEAKLTEKLKMELTKIGVGKESKVEVKLNDGKKISGYLSEINDEDFVVVGKNDDPNRIRYNNVRKAKGRYGHRHFAVSASALGIILGVLLVVLSSNDRGSY